MKLTSVVWNIVGLSGPIIAAALAIPKLVQSIGMEKYGLLSLAWGLLGFSGLFDLGIGRATTQRLAQYAGNMQQDDMLATIKVAENLSFKSGIFGSLLLLGAVAAGFQSHLKFESVLYWEVTLAACILSLTIPIQSVSAMYRGVNEAFGKFREINIIRLGLGLANFFGPLFLATTTKNLAALVATLFISRVIALFMFRRTARWHLAKVVDLQSVQLDGKSYREAVDHLLGMGRWITVSSIINPIFSYADRFFIGFIISAEEVAKYTIPFDVVTQFLIISGAISSVAYPSFSKLSISNPDACKDLFGRWLLRISVVMFIIVIMLWNILPYILPWWIGSIISEESVSIARILCLGVFVNSVGVIIYSFIHSYKRTDITAAFHLIELPFYIVLLYILIAKYGAIGAAWAWVGRVFIDALLLSFSLRFANLNKYRRGGVNA